MLFGTFCVQIAYCPTTGSCKENRGKKHTHNTLAISAMLYASENCTVKARDARRITAAETKYLRITARYALDRSCDKYTGSKGIKCNPQFGTK